MPRTASDTEAAELAALSARLKLDFADETTLVLAVTDSSAGGRGNNTRLAAVGRNVVSAALAEYLYVRYPLLPGEHIDAVLAAMTSHDTLLRAANNIGLAHLVRADEDPLQVCAKCDYC